MTRDSDVIIVPCFICKSKDFDQVILNQNLLDASDFHEFDQKLSGYKYFLTACRSCGHSAVQTNNQCWMPTRKHSFINYGEPTEQYSKVTSIIRGVNLDFTDISIHTFSYKDFQLANFIKNELEISDVNLNNFAGCSDDWLPIISSDGSEREPFPLAEFIKEVKSSKKTHQLILITRFLDHVANHALLEKILSLSSPTRHFIFDINNYDRLFELETLEFIWNERRNLMRRSDIESILEHANLSYSIFTYESPEVAPTLTGVISEKLVMPPKSNPTKMGVLPTPNLVEKLIALRQRWQNILATSHRLGIIGASHKGISLAQFVLDNHAQYSLHDDKEALRGKTPPVNPPLGFHLVSGFDFSDYSHVAITTTLAIAEKIIPKLRASGYPNEILDFDGQKLD